MTIQFNPPAITPFSTGFALNASEWNSRLTESSTELGDGSTDLCPGQIVFMGVAAETITAGNAVRLNSSGLVAVATNASLTGRTDLIGVALESKTIGQSIRVTTNMLTGTSGLTAGQPVYLGAAGALTQTLPTNAVRIGIAISASVIVFQRSLWEQETGTWTPTLTFGGGSTGITYSFRIGRYIRIGKQVNALFHFLLTSEGTSNGNMLVEGLPFTALSSTQLYFPVTIGFASGLGATTDNIVANIGGGNNYFGGFYRFIDGAATTIDRTDTTDTTELLASAVFEIA